MKIFKVFDLKRKVFLCAAFAFMAVLSLQLPGCAVDDDDGDDDSAEQALMDRIAIEDMLTEYYVDLAAGKSHDLAQYYTEDAVFDVNGDAYEGREAIEKLYESVGEGGQPEEGEQLEESGKMHMLLNNLIIKVEGDTATAWMIWTGVTNDDIKGPPRLLEQGREYDKLVKLEGKWFIKERYISADSGLPEMWGETYEPRSFR